MKRFFTLILFGLLSVSAIAGGSYSLLLKSGTFTPPENFENEMKTQINNDAGYFIIQFQEIPNSSAKSQLNSFGIELFDYLPQNAFLAKIPKDFGYSKLDGYSIRSIIPYISDYKSDLALLGDIPIYCQEGAKEVRLFVILFDGNDKVQFASMLSNIGGRINSESSFGEVIEIVIPINKRIELLNNAAVKWVEFGESEPIPDDQHGRTLHRVHNVQNGIAGRDYDGTGVSVSLVDDAPIAAHIDVKNRLAQIPPIFGNGSHGDGTVGIVMGAGNLDPTIAGMATGVTMLYYDYISQGNYPHINAAVSNYTNFGTIATSSSYSEFSGFGGIYTSTANFVDNQVRLNPSIIHVFSAGNSAASTSPTYTVGSPWATITGGRKAAKSTIATGSVNYEDILAGFSSRGPAADGRIKPDICAYGSSQISLGNGANTFQTFGGTSAACPGITGTVAVMYQAYRELNSNQDPHSGLIKAMLLNSADDLGNPGPDFFYGWGRLNALRSIRTLENNQYLTDTLSQGDSNTHVINIPSGVSEMKVMVYWTDFEGSITSSQALVNDIDIELEDASSGISLPWVLDHRDILSSLNSNAVNGVDSVNNMEQVSLSNPTSGSYTLRVKGKAVPQGPQIYYVVYEFRYPKPEITYPTGGESFVPGEIESIRWNANSLGGSFDLFYSMDAGSTWNTIITGLSSNLRSFDWSVPSGGFTGDALIRINDLSSGDTSDLPFNILELPSNFQITWACTDSVLLTWDSVPGATSYQIYQLGSTYMDSIDITNDISYVANNAPSSAVHWFSVHAQDMGNIIGRRTVAIEKATGTFDCPVPNDASVSEIESPKPGNYPGCQGFDSITVEIEIENRGNTSLSNIPVAFQLNSQPVVVDTFVGTLSRYQKASFEFPGTITIVGPLDTIKAWTALPLDGDPSNDQVSGLYDLYTSSMVNIPWVENFDLMAACPTTGNCEGTNCTLTGGWKNVQNLFGDDIDFRVNSGFTPSGGTGPNNDHTSGNGNYVYTEASAGASTPVCANKTVIMISPCINLQFAISPELKFWYHMFGSTMGDLHLDLIVNGSVVEDIVSPIIGNQDTLAWLQKIIDLSPYVGNIINLKFRGITGSGFTSDMALDDISVIETATFVQDAGILSFISPSLSVSETCMIQDSTDVEMVISNNGQFPIANFNIAYQLDNLPTVIQAYTGIISPGSTDTVLFNQRIALFAAGSYDLKTWHNFSLDQNPGNDTLTKQITINNSILLAAPTIETMASFSNCATTSNCGGTNCALGNGWVNVPNGGIDDIDWRTDQGGTPSAGTGPSGDHSSGTGKYLYLEASNGCTGETAVLESPCIDLSSVLDPKLRIWYHMFGGAMGDLHLDVGVGGNWIEDFVPPISGAQGNSWQAWVIDLSFFAGGNLKFRIRGVTGTGFASDMAIDDIEIYSGLIAPTAGFNLDANTCENQTISISDSSTGSSLSYQWNFGPNALPQTANTVGPHNVIFTSGGNQDVSLVVSNAVGSDSVTQSIYVDSLPTADFQFTAINYSVVFQNTALNYKGVFWDFGDGDSSSLINPSHVYNTSGVFLVEQKLDNPCGSDSTSKTVLIISGLDWAGNLVEDLNIFPNPAENQINLHWSGVENNSGIVEIVDAKGKSMYLGEIHSQPGNNEVSIDISEFSAGTYLLKLNLGKENGVFKIEKR